MDVIVFGRVRRVVIGGYVAGKNLDWYLGHQYAHNVTIAHGDRGKPTLKDDERPFRYGLFCDL